MPISRYAASTSPTARRLQAIELRVRIAGPNSLSDGASDRMVVVGAAIWVGEIDAPL